MNSKWYLFLLVFIAAIAASQNRYATRGGKDKTDNRRADFDAMNKNLFKFFK